jgi:hypothetical protein
VRPEISYAKLPLSFEENQGQKNKRVKFIAQGRGYGLFLTGNAAVLSLRSQESGDGSQKQKRPWFVVSGPLQELRYNGELRTPIGDGARKTKVLRINLVGANLAAKVVGLEELPGKANYFIGSDPKLWRTNVPTYARVKYQSVYPGVDLVCYGNQRGQLEYDFVVAPGADPGSILLALDVGGRVGSRQKAVGSHQPQADSNGDLVVGLAGDDEVRFRKPVAYQDKSSSLNGQLLATVDNRQSAIGNRQFVDGRFVLLADDRIGFAVSDYDRARPLVIDPVLVYSTCLGGAAGSGIAVDSFGSAYVTGGTLSGNFPTVDPIQGGLAGSENAFVAKLNPVGSALVYSTYLGGGGSDSATGITVDSSGNAYVTGDTNSTNFPAVHPIQANLAGIQNAFVAELNSTGSALIYSTCLGGSGYDQGSGIAVDSSGNAYVTGTTPSTDFPTSHPFQASLAGEQNAFVAKLNWNGSALSLAYSTFLGGGDEDGLGIALDCSGNAYVTGATFSTNFPTAHPFQASLAGGEDAFVSKLNASGSALVYSTYLGGSGDDEAHAIAVDSSGSAYITGSTSSIDFPTVNPLQASKGGGINAFVTKLNPAGAALVYSTFLGADGTTSGNGIAVDPSENAYVTGVTNTPNFPMANPIEATLGEGVDESAFVAEMSPSGSAFVYSTYLGANAGSTGSGIAADANGNAYVTGGANPGFPSVNSILSILPSSLGGAYVAKISGPPEPGARVILSTNTLNFGDQLQAVTSSVQSVALMNTGADSLTIANITVLGDFALARTKTSCPYTEGTVASEGVCTIDVTFTPTAAGIRSGSLTINDNAGDSPQNVSLLGKGSASAPVAAVSPGTLAFGPGWLHSVGPAQSVTFSNTGNAALTITGIGVSGNFSQTDNCGGSVAAGSSCSIEVTYSPTAIGPISGTLTVVDNSNGVEGSTQSVALSGTGEEFELNGPGSYATIKPGWSATYTLSALVYGGVSQSVNFTCTGAPSEATCAVSPNPATVGSSSTSVTVTVTTTAPSAVAPLARPSPPVLPLSPAPTALLTFALVLTAMLGAARKQAGESRGTPPMVALALWLLLTLALAGCGSGSGTSPNAGTPAGTYTLTVQGTAGSGPSAPSQSVPLTLIVVT